MTGSPPLELVKGIAYFVFGTQLIVSVIVLIISLFLIFKKELREEARLGLQIILVICSLPSLTYPLFQFVLKGCGLPLFFILIQFPIVSVTSLIVLNIDSLKKYTRQYGVALLISLILYLVAGFISLF